MGDLLMIAAILACGLGYAEGGRLSRHMGGLGVIAWALVLSLPLMGSLAFVTRPATLVGVGWPALAGLAYVSLFSMLIGFIFWYRGLANGGIAAVGQLQLVQPFFALMLAAGLLHETVGLDLLAILAGVVACVAGARRFAPPPKDPAPAESKLHPSPRLEEVAP
jgi:drug/metabolite transporter (DMT)-like permease